MAPRPSPAGRVPSLLTGPSISFGCENPHVWCFRDRYCLVIPGPLRLTDDLLEEAGRASWRQGFGGKAVHDFHVMIYVGAPFQVQGACELLDVHDIRQVWFTEAQHGEGAARASVATAAERHHLESDVGQPGYVDEALNLGSHHLAAADRAAQRCLVHDRPHPWWLRPGEHVLALHPQAHPAVDLLSRRGLVAEHGDGPGVLLGLEQAMHELEFKAADDRSDCLQPQVCLEPVGKDVAVFRPPARCVGLPGQRQHLRLCLGVGNAVQDEQVAQVPVLEADPAILHPADLGAGCPDLIPCLIWRESCGLAKTAKLVAQEHAQYGRVGPYGTRGAVRRLNARLHRAHSRSRTNGSPALSTRRWPLAGSDHGCPTPASLISPTRDIRHAHARLTAPTEIAPTEHK